MATIRLPARDVALLIDAVGRCGEARALSPSRVADVLDALVGLVHCDAAVWEWSVVGVRLVDRVLIGTTRGVVAGRELANRRLPRAALVPAGAGSRIGLELSHGPGEMSVVVLSRGAGRPFDERDRTVLRLVRPHVDVAFRRMTRPPPHLSAREHEVLLLVRDGLTNGQVARRLGVAEATVAKHLENVFARTGAHNRAQAVAMCAEVLDTPPAGDR